MKVSLNASIYVLLTSLMFAFSEVRESAAFYTQMIIGSIMIFVILFFKAIIKGELVLEKKVIHIFLLYFIPQVILHIWGSYVGYKAGNSLYKFTPNFSIYYAIIFAFFAVLLFKEKSIEYTILAFCLGVTYKSINEILEKGFGIFKEVFKLSLEGDFPLEFSDPILCLSYIFVALYCINSIYISNKKKYFLFCIIFFVLGRKRIVLLSAGIAIAWYYIISKLIKFKNVQDLCYNLTRYVLFFASYLYIYIQSLGDAFYEFLNSHGINLSGRNYFYRVMNDWYEFTPQFIGLGKNVTFGLMQNVYSYFGIKAIHSDFLKIYIENGFIIFGVWAFYNFIILPYIFKKKYGRDSMIILLLCTVVMFVLYISDNTDTYFGCRLFLTMLPMASCFLNNNSEEIFN